MELNKIYNMDCSEGLKLIDNNTVDCCVTSPPYYGLRDYGLPKTRWSEVEYSPLPGMNLIQIPEWEGCLGLEPTIEMFVGHIVLIFREIYRTLKKAGTCWVNFGDSYVGTSGDRKNPVQNELFNLQQSHNPDDDRHNRNKSLKNSGLKEKDLMGIPWRVAFALQSDGWYLRMDNIWDKLNCMPESAKDRPTKSHEYIFLLSKSKNYYYDQEVIKELCVNGDPNPPRGSVGVLGNPQKGRREKGNAKTFRGGGVYTKGQSFDNSADINRESHGNQPNVLGLRNKRSVWHVATDKLGEAHFATFPPKLIEPCILAGCPVNGVVLDPFMGSGTTAMVTEQNNRNFVGFELNPKYIEIADRTRLSNVQLKIV